PAPFDGPNLAERIHRHPNGGKLDAQSVALHPDLDVCIHNPLHGHKDFHFPVTSPEIVGRAIAVRALSELSKADIPGGISVQCGGVSVVAAIRPVTMHDALKSVQSRGDAAPRPHCGAGCAGVSGVAPGSVGTGTCWTCGVGSGSPSAPASSGTPRLRSTRTKTAPAMMPPI